MQIEDHGELQPSLTCPDITDITRPFLIWRISREVTIQQVRGYIELVVIIRRDLVFAGAHDRYAVLAHQTPDTAVAHVQADFF